MKPPAKTLAAILLALAAIASPALADRKPNLIVIMADDLGYQDVGFNGSKDIPTPHIDRIATEGVRFTSGYVTYPVCGPSRAGFLTGRYPQRFGFERNPQYRPRDPGMGLPLSEKTIADVLRNAGYATGLIGKWHMGAHPSLHPMERGFDEFFGHLGGGHIYFCDQLAIRSFDQANDEAQSYRTLIERGRTPVETTGYLTDVFSQEAVEFIGRHKATPFFLFLSYNAPHTPMQATEKYLSRFQGIKDKKRRTYAAMVSAMDDGIGLVLASLDTHGLANDTLVVFLSDNGGAENSNASNNGKLRGQKSDVWEGGFRVPFAMRWPAKLKPGEFHHPVSAIDILPTIAKAAGARPDPSKPLDGVDLLPHLLGSKTSAPHAAIYLRKFDQGAFAVRQGALKMVIPQKGTPARLYDLAADPAETRDLAAERPQDLERLETLRSTWNTGLIEPIFEGLKMRDPQKRPAANRQPTPPLDRQ